MKIKITKIRGKLEKGKFFCEDCGNEIVFSINRKGVVEYAKRAYIKDTPDKNIIECMFCGARYKIEVEHPGTNLGKYSEKKK